MARAVAISYQLVIEVPTVVRCVVGRLGEVEFPAGEYVYTGSARRTLESRIARHRRPSKKLRWHIDYLLAAPGVRITRIVRSRREECALNKATAGQLVVPGFGASDCNSGCGGHLKHLAGPGG
jgi:Uri superfamily endonuclease